MSSLLEHNGSPLFQHTAVSGSQRISFQEIYWLGIVCLAKHRLFTISCNFFHNLIK